MLGKYFKIKVLLAAVLIVAAAASSFALSIEELQNNLQSTIKNYALGFKPEWKGQDVRVVVEQEEKFLSPYQSFKKVKFSIPDTFRITKFTPRIILPIKVNADGVDSKTQTLWIKIEVYQDVVVAQSKIRKNQLISSECIKLTEKEVALLPNNYFTDYKDVLNKVAKNTIYQGSVIYEWMIKEKPVVIKGSKVKIVVIGKGLLVESSGIALEDGQVGDKIDVRRTDSKEKIEAEVLNANEVRIKL